MLCYMKDLTLTVIAGFVSEDMIRKDAHILNVPPTCTVQDGCRRAA